ncbi:MAG: hypothetical protein ACPG32_03485 [Akkermansiaceae bacterium]
MNQSIEIKPIRPHLYIITGAGMVLAVWLWWLIEHFTGFRIGRFGASPREEAISHWYPLIATPLIFIGTVLWWKRSADIVKHGVLVDATVLHLGITSSSMQDATVSYQVNGQAYQVKKSFDASDLEKCQVGSNITIVADKRNPKRILIQQ